MKKLIKIILSLCMLISCTNNYQLKEIKIDKIFLINEDKYIVYFYSSTCRACLDTLELLNKRYQNKKYPGFLVKTNNIDINYSDDKVNNLGVSNYKGIVISVLPYLVYIEEKKIVKELFGYTEIHKENFYIFFE